MNYRIVARLLGLLMLTFGASMAPALGWGLYYGDGSAGPLVEAMVATLLLGGALLLAGRGAELEQVYRREATATVSLAWLLSAVCGALPYAFADLEEMPGFADCLFESMSGLTTTGSTVLANIEAVPRGLLFWRSWTHWIGGIGIIMLFVAILPYLGAGGRVLVKSEATGPVKEALTPRIRDTALILFRLYLGYTLVQAILLMAAGMNLFDALCHSFGAVATGGFSTKNASIGHYYETGAIEVIILVFMLLSGSSFALINQLFRGRVVTILRDAEWRFFLASIFGSALFIAATLLATERYESADLALRDALFSAASLATTTGYVTVDFDAWPDAARLLLVALMCMGGCAGSTSGGLKVIRVVMGLKILAAQVEKVFRPNSVRKVRVGGVTVSEELQSATLGFFLLYGMFFMASAFLLLVMEMGDLDLVSAMTAVAATINGVGPGLGQVGGVESFAFFTDGSKYLLSAVMLAGRLEFYALLVLGVPAFWSRR